MQSSNNPIHNSDEGPRGPKQQRQSVEERPVEGGLAIDSLSLESKPLLQNLLRARGPSGKEAEVRTICRQVFEKFCDLCFEDAAGNMVGVIRAAKATNSPVRVFAHMDELSLIVKRVDPNGRLSVRPLGGYFPGNIGQGPMDIMGLSGKIVPGVLSFGSMHVTTESGRTWGLSRYGGNCSPDWNHVHVETRLSPGELQSLDVRPGSRVVLGSSRRDLVEIGDCWGGFFMDNRAPLTAMLMVAKLLRERRSELSRDCYLVATTNEETNTQGAAFAGRLLPAGITLAVDVGPVAQEYGTELVADPIVVFKDDCGLYDEEIATAIMQLGKENDLNVLPVVFENYGSDASGISSRGHTGRSALVCIPTLNTHGYELIHRNGVGALAKLLLAIASTDHHSFKNKVDGDEMTSL
ncbi:MAG: hypothetical protein RL518_2785 [Pseudomonadota bacterium]